MYMRVLYGAAEPP